MFYYIRKYLQIAYQVYNNYNYYIQHQQINEELFDNLLEKIKATGCVAVKFTQWSIPILKMNVLSEEDIETNNLPEWIRKLEALYQYCNNHSEDHTKEIYHQDFNEAFDDNFKIIELLASGSIGQVYKVKKNNNFFAMKVIHPEVYEQILDFERVILFITTMPYIKKILYQTIPFDILDFIKDFKTQIDFINEANNMLEFKRIYSDNHYIIIPNVYKISKNIILMSYEEADDFNLSSINSYQKSKLMFLLNGFVRENMLIDFVHGDLHQGNWKIKQEGDKYKLVIYDFGYCYKLCYPIELNIKLMNWFDLPTEYRSDSLDDLFEIINYASEKEIPRAITDNKMDELRSIIHQYSPINLYKLLHSICIETDNQINYYIIRALLVSIQLYSFFLNYKVISIYNSHSYTINSYKDMYSLYKTYGVFDNFSKQCKRLIDTYSQEHFHKPILISETISTNETIKQLALKFDTNNKSI